jgi:hypothetical protein
MDSRANSEPDSWVPEDFEPRGVAAAAESGNGASPAEDESWTPEPPIQAAAAARAPAPVRPPAPARGPAPVRPPERSGTAAAPARAPAPVRPLGPSGGATAPADGRLDLNALGFDELRELRLSITQTKRLLAQREQRGGFRSLDELDDVPGFPRYLIADLKRLCRV